jgi:hypothetical protein
MVAQADDNLPWPGTMARKNTSSREEYSLPPVKRGLREVVRAEW